MSPSRRAAQWSPSNLQTLVGTRTVDTCSEYPLFCDSAPSRTTVAANAIVLHNPTG